MKNIVICPYTQKQHDIGLFILHSSLYLLKCFYYMLHLPLIPTSWCYKHLFMLEQYPFPSGIINDLIPSAETLLIQTLVRVCLWFKRRASKLVIMRIPRCHLEPKWLCSVKWKHLIWVWFEPGKPVKTINNTTAVQRGLMFPWTPEMFPLWT